MERSNRYTLPATLLFSAIHLAGWCQVTAKPDKTQVVITDTLRIHDLPRPYATRSVNRPAQVTGWPADKAPLAPRGFTVTKFAEQLHHPRWIYVGPNGDIFVSEGGGANDILLFRDNDHNGQPELKSVFLSGLNRPFGMLILENWFYVAETDGLRVYHYQAGQTRLTDPGRKILDLPAGGYNNHWTRNILASPDGKKIFITVGSGSNIGENGMANEKNRACILEINSTGTGQRVYAGGLRNPQGMAFAPGTHTLWTAVNERDGLGDDLPPDFLTSVRDGRFYGWPYSYWGRHPDPRLKGRRFDLVKKTTIPEVNMGAHTASLGLAFEENLRWPGIYKGGAFIGQHGSWNRSQLSGYQVAFVPFKNGRPAGRMRPFLTGFIADKSARKVYGRPVGVAFDRTGGLLVADDAGNAIWRIAPLPRLRTISSPGNRLKNKKIPGQY
jgi:glucose/arabinose dehydrogenase